MATAAILNSDHCAIFLHDRCVLHWIRNMPTKFGEDWPTSNTFLKFKMAAAAILSLVKCAFSQDSCILSQIRNIPTKFGEDWSYSKEMVVVTRNP